MTKRKKIEDKMTFEEKKASWDALSELGRPHRFKPGVSGNPKGRIKGSKNKLKNGPTVEEAFAEMAQRGLSHSEMLVKIAEKAYKQDTMQGMALALKALMEANKYIETTKDAKEVNKTAPVEDMSEKEIKERLFKIVNG